MKTPSFYDEHMKTFEGMRHKVNVLMTGSSLHRGLAQL